ncbi:hypothetical protein ACHAWF_007605 [Thalassiosira exigua]
MEQICEELESYCHGGWSAGHCTSFATHCCEEEDDQCRCDYAKKDCSASLQGLATWSVSYWKYSDECSAVDELCGAGVGLFESKCHSDDAKTCTSFATHCCDEEDAQCRCDYAKKACAASLQFLNDDFEVSDGTSLGPTSSPVGSGAAYAYPETCASADEVCGADGRLDLYRNKGCTVLEREYELGDNLMCTDYANLCCDEFDGDCKCRNTKKACIAAVESGNDVDTIPSECIHADEVCCPECKLTFQFQGPHIQQCSCGCDLWEPLCMSHPSSICDIAAGRCCGSPALPSLSSPIGPLIDDIHDPLCYCDFFNYLDQNMQHKLKNNTCIEAKKVKFQSKSKDDEENVLRGIYNETSGAYWTNRSGWQDNETDYCEWYGVACDEEDFVAGIDLTNNNVSGLFPSQKLTSLLGLKVLKLSGNSLSGRFQLNSLYQLSQLVHLDVSQNNLKGEVDILLSPSLEYVNISHNSLSSTTAFKKFKSSHLTLKTLDLSHNNIRQDITGVLRDLPPNLNGLLAASNQINGTLPDPFPVLSNLEELLMNNNNISGSIPDISRSLPRLKALNLSHQKGLGNRGLSGSIPDSWAKLQDFLTLDLSFNELQGTIPSDLGNLAKLKELVLSNNELHGAIPADLGRLDVSCELLDASNNQLSGNIPSEFGMLEASVILSGNSDLFTPAPLRLCDSPDFDLQNDAVMCPYERAVLEDFYYSAKGSEWTDNSNWTDQYIEHCFWHGITCKDGMVSAINLTNNGLSGKLDEGISNLVNLEVLDVNDNDIKGNVPSSLGKLSKLHRLRLSYNSFTGAMPKELEELQQMELVHLHGNRFFGKTGTIPDFNKGKQMQDASSFIADCGLPTDFDEALDCAGCTMCCNSNGDCHPTEPNKLEQVQLKGFENYAHFTWVFGLITFGFAFLLVMASSLYDKHKNASTPSSASSRLLADKDKVYALDTVGKDSVYSWFLSTSLFAWSIALTITAVQVALLIVFIFSARMIFSDSTSDFQYSWKCPRNSMECVDGADDSWIGWTMFAVLMLSHMLKDIVSGIRLLVLSGKRRHRRNDRIRFFVGGLILFFVSSFTIFATTVYNLAIARSNTDIIANAVVILFVIEMDEQLHTAAGRISPKWAASLAWSQGGGVEGAVSAGSNNGGGTDDNGDIENVKREQMESQFDMLERQVQQLVRQNEELTKRVRNLEIRESVTLSVISSFSEDPMGLVSSGRVGMV